MIRNINNMHLKLKKYYKKVIKILIHFYCIYKVLKVKFNEKKKKKKIINKNKM